LTTSQSTVAAFFEQYSKAFSAHDIHLLVDMFAYPGHVVSNTGSIVLVSIDSRETWLPRISELLAMYDSVGFSNAIVRTLTTRILSNNIIQADVNWELRNVENVRLYDFDTIYTLIQNNTNWYIAQAISPNELIRYKAYVSARH
jgi:hypothetical protein